MKLSDDYLFLRACRKEDVERTPVWLMRQAGRYMEEYQAIRRQHSFLDMCKNPKVAAEVTLQPIDRLNVDAAILFSDILVPIEFMGMELEFQEKVGPVIHNPVRDMDSVEKLTVPDPKESVPFVMEAIRILREKLRGRVPLIGFSGAPFTLASYMVEGRGSRDYRFTKAIMFSQPQVWNALMDKISDTVIGYLNAQIEAGAQAVQVFDSWVGSLNPEDYHKYVMPHTKRVIDNLEGDVPVIHFANQGSTLLEYAREAGGDVLGVDWRINLDDAWKRIGYDRGIQGNIDPMTLFASREVIQERVKDVLDRAENRPGHIFNLGHGIHKDTPVENVVAMVEAVRKFSAR